MELFFTSYLPSASFISDTSQLSLIDSIDSSGGAEAGPNHQDFIKFIQHVIALKVEILAMTWDPALERFNGEGSLGTVSRGGVNADMTFSYKRFRPEPTDPRYSDEQFRELQYAAIVNELTVLASPGLRDHDNIVRLVGICFELSPNNVDVWPVLVLLTANGGELARTAFIRKIVGEDILLRICGEIAKGLHALHRHGVFHCDVNPRNILVWRDARNGGTAVLLADFGYSKFGAADELTRLPKVEPWEAPEWHPRKFELGDIQKMDMYSFGLICLWLFFREESLVDLELPSATVESAFLALDHSAVARVQSKKAEGNSILDWARNLVRRSELGAHVKSRLERVFDLTLDTDRSQRASSMEELTNILLGPSPQSQQDSVEQPNAVVMPAWHGVLEISKLLATLEVSDYRVHRFLTRSLGGMANLEGCECCKRNAAFQLALCHFVGFGVEPNGDALTTWLSIAGKTRINLDEAVESIKSFKPEHMYNPVDFPAKLGYQNDVGSQYEADGILEDALCHYQRMVFEREQSLGQEHFSTLRLKIILVGILRRMERFEEAMEIVVGMTGLASISLTDRVAISTYLARLWADLGDIEQAEPLLRNLLDWYSEGPEAKNPERLRLQHDLIMLLLGRGGYDEALDLSLKHVDECVEELGLDHEGTRYAYRCLAASYDANGKLKEAIEASEHIEAMVKRRWAARITNRAIVHDTACLGVQYYRCGDEISALRCYKKVMQLVGQDSELARSAVYAVNSTIPRLLRRGSHEQAAEMLRALLAECTRVLGAGSKETVAVMGNLASTYFAQLRLDDAAELERQVVEARRQTLGETHADTIVALGNLRQTLLLQGKFADAAELAREEMASLKRIYGDTPGDELIDAVETIARALVSPGGYAEAIPFLEEEMALRRAAQRGCPNGGIISAMARAAGCRLHVGQLPAARELVAELLLCLADLDGVEEIDNSLVGDMARLAKECLEKDCVVEAGQVLSGASGMVSQAAMDNDIQTALDAARDEYLQKISRAGGAP